MRSTNHLAPRYDGGTNFILRIKEQETRLTLYEHDDDDDDDNDELYILRHAFVMSKKECKD